MSKKTPKSFILYCNFENQFKLLSLEERGILISAIFEYAKEREFTTELPPLVNMAFSLIKDTMDRDYEEYLERCEKNAMNGKKGGRPRKTEESDGSFIASKTERYSEKPKKAYNDNKNDIDNDIDIDIDNGSGNDNYSNTKQECPHTTSSAGSADSVNAYTLSNSDRELLIDKGIPSIYIDERTERAREFAKAQKKSAYAVLLEWWEKDRTIFGRYHSSKKLREKTQSSDKSYDTDEFFEAACRRAREEFGIYS